MMSYEENVHLEAHRRASRKIGPPVVKPATGGYILAIPFFFCPTSWASPAFKQQSTAFRRFWLPSCF